jgi:hypothetical protein
MTLVEYLDAWKLDAVIHLDTLDEDAAKVPVLHARWWKYYAAERLRFKNFDRDYQALRHNKHVWYSGKMLDEDRVKLGWPPQPKLIRLREDIEQHVTADADIQKLAADRSLSEETVRFLEDVIKCINKRGYDIKNCIDYLKFKSGV